MPEIFQRKQHEYFPATTGKILYFFLYQLQRDKQPPLLLLVLNKLYPLQVQATPADMMLAEVNTFIDHDPPQPSGKGRRLFQLPQVPECIYKCILEHVLGVGRVTCHPDADIIHGCAVIPVEISLSATVALPGLDYGQFMYVGWMLQVLVTTERLQKTPSIRAVKDEEVGKSGKKY
jgi:hypothetical protein